MRTIKQVTKLLQDNKSESPIPLHKASWLFSMQTQEHSLLQNNVIQKVAIDGEIWYNIL